MFISVCSGADYFVSVQGSDENPGTIGSPFLTIQKAADIVEGGDVINIMRKDDWITRLYYEKLNDKPTNNRDSRKDVPSKKKVSRKKN